MKELIAKLPLGRSGYCVIDGCYHIGTIGDYNKTGMKINNEHSIDELIIDVSANKDTVENRQMADYILLAINNFHTTIDLLAMNDITNQANDILNIETDF